MLKQRDKQTVTQSRQQRRRWAGPACHLGGLGGGGLPPCTLASWLVLKHWLKITLIVWELLLQQCWLWPPRGPRQQELVPPTSLGSCPLGVVPSWPQLCLLPTSRDTWRAGWAAPKALSFWQPGLGLCAQCCLGLPNYVPPHHIYPCPSVQWADQWMHEKAWWQLWPRAQQHVVPRTVPRAISGEVVD